MIIVKLFGEIQHRNRTFFKWGLLYLLLFVLALGLTFFDHRQLMGINIWIKPSKFALSIAIFLFTMAWYNHYLPPGKTLNLYTKVAIIVFLVEILAVFGQAARGVKSHFNISTTTDAMIFQTMGLAITINTLFVLIICFLFFIKKTDLPKPYLWGIRLGMLLFVVFSFEGFIMAQQLSHTVGGSDGTKGVAYLNWSKQYGDLRVAHFIGMHALQIVPITGWLISESNVAMLKKFGTVLIILFAMLYFAFAAYLFLQALHGYPLLSFNNFSFFLFSS
ncbi:hypothetical protein C3K47_18415 [Solitalea longa]|uniref:Uncharacterized protein n=1 Tax=Solitalea longa TaxID=2079460 RepID=A0A2S4ZY47_9SPHI|nr:hypothetical protein [Solitalea longa]POY34813.1 hypothetical protein C3K47_18415 [Solitalea longa]